MLKIVGFVVIVAVTAYFIRMDELIEHLTWRLALAVVLIQPLVFLTCAPITTRFRLLTGRPKLRYWAVYKAMLVGLGLNLIVPGRAAELLKVVYLQKKEGLPFAQGAAALFMERLGDLIIASAMAVLSLNLFMFGLDTVGVIVSLAVLFTVVTAIPFMERPLLFVLSLIPWRGLKEMLKEMLRHVVSNTRNGVFYMGMFIGGFAWFLSFLSIYLFLIMVEGGNPITPYGALAVLVATTFGGAIPALPGGFGTYEAAGVLVLSGFGYGFEEALAVILALHASQVLFLFLAGLAIAVIEGSGVAALMMDLRDYRRGR